MRIRRAGTSVHLLLATVTTLGTAPAIAQSIVSVAGGGTDDGLHALSVDLHPGDAAVDAAGNLYTVSGNRIRKVAAANGIVRTVAGNGSSGTSGDGGLAVGAGMSPGAIAIDVRGNLWLTDSGCNCIRRVDLATGLIWRVAGNGSEVHSGDGGPALWAGMDPRDLAVDGIGNVFVADWRNNRVRRIDAASGTVTTVAGNGASTFSGDGGPATAAGVATPSGVAVDASGNLFVSSSGSSRIRRVAAGTGTISTFAGSGSAGPYGDGGPATAAALDLSRGRIEVGREGTVLFVDGHDIRMVAPATGLIGTYAGIPDSCCGSFGGDGGPATAAGLAQPEGLAVHPSGDVVVADTWNGRLRRVEAGTGIILTVAGGVRPPATNDGGSATLAILASPQGVAVDARGNLYVVDADNDRIRRVDGTTGTIATLAGNGWSGDAGDGGPATLATVSPNRGIALDGRGPTLYFTQAGGSHRVRRVDLETGIVSAFAGGNGGEAGGFSGDGGPATLAALATPTSVAVDGRGTVYIADAANARVRRVDGFTGIITTVAGSGSRAFTGDGGPATAAGLDTPEGVAVDAAGDLYVADAMHDRVRKVSLATGTIETVAGSATSAYTGDGGPATAAGLLTPRAVWVDGSGDLLIADDGHYAIRRVDARTGLISTVAGTGVGVYAGDGGPASQASLNMAIGVTADARGNLFLPDARANRVRAVLACGPVGAPGLVEPATATVDGSAATFVWSAVPGAFRYDLYLDTVDPPARVVASDLAYTTPSPLIGPAGGRISRAVMNLASATRYFWKVVAKGDPFCPLPVSAASEVRSFTTVGRCDAPGWPTLVSPARDEEGIAQPVTLTWEAGSAAGTFDVYLGSSSLLPLVASGLTSTSFTVPPLTPGALYSWVVAAHASCDPTRTCLSDRRSFRVGGGCPAPQPFSLVSPADGSGVASYSPLLTWSPSASASSYDVYLGTAPDPPLYASGVAGTSLQAPLLSGGLVYRWKVVARTSCDHALTASTPVQTFSVAFLCDIPGFP